MSPRSSDITQHRRAVGGLQGAKHFVPEDHPDRLADAIATVVAAAER